jgi:hypothetical protein
MLPPSHFDYRGQSVYSRFLSSKQGSLWLNQAKISSHAGVVSFSWTETLSLYRHLCAAGYHSRSCTTFERDAYGRMLAVTELVDSAFLGCEPLHFLKPFQAASTLQELALFSEVLKAIPLESCSDHNLSSLCQFLIFYCRVVTGLGALTPELVDTAMRYSTTLSGPISVMAGNVIALYMWRTKSALESILCLNQSLLDQIQFMAEPDLHAILLLNRARLTVMAGQPHVALDLLGQSYRLRGQLGPMPPGLHLLYLSYWLRWSQRSSYFPSLLLKLSHPSATLTRLSWRLSSSFSLDSHTRLILWSRKLFWPFPSGDLETHCRQLLSINC